MAVRDDLRIDWYRSPRLVTVKASQEESSTEITIQDLVDTLRNIEDEPGALSEPHLISASGKEDLGGSVKVGITANLNNAQLAFEARTTPASVGAATSADPGTVLIDSGATFQADGVQPGDLVVNFTDQSAATVLSVDCETQITHEPLAGGPENDWGIGDDYKIYSVVQCNIAGGNLVAIDAQGGSLDPVRPTAFTQIVRTSSSSATLQELTPIQFSSLKDSIADAVWNEGATEHAVTGSFAELLKQIYTMQSGRWKMANNQMIFYGEDNVTPLVTLNLLDAAGQPSMVDVFERVPV